MSRRSSNPDYEDDESDSESNYPDDESEDFRFGCSDDEFPDEEDEFPDEEDCSWVSYPDNRYEECMDDDEVLEALRLFFERVEESVSVSEPAITHLYGRYTVASPSNESIIRAHAAEIVRKNRTFVRRLNPCHPDYEAYESDSDDGWS